MKMKGVRLLIADDESHQRHILKEFLESLGAQTLQADNGKTALAQVKAGEKIDLVLSDLQMPDMNGIDLLKNLRMVRDDLPFVLMTAHGSMESAIQAIRLGASDYILKPLELEEVKIRIQKILELKKLTQKAEWLEGENKRLAKPGSAVFESPVMKKLFADLARVVESDATVLLTGETGAGKEVLARYLHENGPRAKGPFVAINCSAIPENLLESQFFGHEKGSFTGADRRVVGSFELADGGTLFLDEIGEMDLKLQAKILRALEERKIQRVGSPQPVDIDVRIVAATNRALPELVKAKQFREDLYYRLNVVHFSIPPLRERKEDLAPLVKAFVAREAGAKRQIKIEESFLNKLKTHKFPGNVRELKNMIERAVLFTHGDALTEASLPPDMSQAIEIAGPSLEISGAESLAELVEGYEKTVVQAAVKACGGDVEQAAKKLKVSRSALYAKISKYGDA